MTRLLPTLALLLVAAIPAAGQLPAAPPPPPPPPPTEGGLTVRDSSVGYIDSAAPADQVRLRADLRTDFRAPNRAEFFYPQGQPRGPGLPRPERAIDFQDATLYLERMVAPAWSVFAEGGLRALNPDVNANAAGLADANVGFKYAVLSGADGIGTVQFRAYLPTGAPGRGLGTGHVSLEPAVLGFYRLTEDLGLASEVRYWHPVDGTDFAGGVLRYGLGLRYEACAGDGWRLAPTLEAIGWSILGGRESRLMPDGTVGVRDAGGTTVVNLKLGARLDLGEQAGFYAGYGRAVTADRWYRDVFRIEFRWLY